MKVSTGEVEAHTLTERRVILKTEAQARSKKTIVCHMTNLFKENVYQSTESIK
jgi:hypothetical protein